MLTSFLNWTQTNIFQAKSQIVCVPFGSLHPYSNYGSAFYIRLLDVCDCINALVICMCIVLSKLKFFSHLYVVYSCHICCHQKKHLQPLFLPLALRTNITLLFMMGRGSSVQLVFGGELLSFKIQEICGFHFKTSLIADVNDFHIFFLKQGCFEYLGMTRFGFWMGAYLDGVLQGLMLNQVRQVMLLWKLLLLVMLQKKCTKDIGYVGADFSCAHYALFAFQFHTGSMWMWWIYLGVQVCRAGSQVNRTPLGKSSKSAQI